MSGRELAGAALAATHVGAAAGWLGAMAYSLLVVQPRAEAALPDRMEYERFAVALAAGARWKVLAVCAVLALSGAGLVVLELADAGGRPPLWIALVAAKAVLLAVAVGLFAHVSWRLLPARLFALPDELPALRARFRAVAVALTAVVAAGLVLGAVADALR